MKNWKNTIFIVDEYIKKNRIDIRELTIRIYQHMMGADTDLPEQEKKEYESYAREMIRNMMIALLSDKYLT